MGGIYGERGKKIAAWLFVYKQIFNLKGLKAVESDKITGNQLKYRDHLRS